MNSVSIISGGRLMPFGRVLVVVLTAWALAVIVPDFSRAWSNLATLGFAANNDGRITSVDGDPALAQGLSKGDTIDLRRTSRRDLAAVYAGLGGTQYVRPRHTVRLFVTAGPSGGRLTRLYVLTPVTKNLDWVTKTVLITDQCLGVFFVGLAAILVWRRPSPVTLGFLFYALWFNPGQTYAAYAWLQGNWRLLVAQEFLQSLAYAAGYAGILVFALRFPDDKPQGWRLQVERFLPAFFAIFTILQWPGYGSLFGWRTERWSELPFYVGYAVDLLVLVILYVRSREQNPIDRQRTRWVLWACRLGLFAFIFADSNASTALWDPLWRRLGWYPDETLLNCFYMLNAPIALAVLYAIHRHHVIDVSFAASRAVVQAGTWLVIGGGLVALSLPAEHMLEKIMEQRALLLAAIIAVSLQLEWLHERICERMDHVLFKPLYRAEEHLARVAASLAGACSPAAAVRGGLDGIDSTLVNEPAGALGLASAAVLRRQADGGYRPDVETIGWPATGVHPSRLARTDPLVAQLARIRGALRLRDMSLSTPGMPDGTARPVLALPVITHGTVAAIALYGLHTSGTDLNAKEVKMLTGLAGPASLAYEEVEVAMLRRDLAALRAQGARPKRSPHTARPR